MVEIYTSVLSVRWEYSEHLNEGYLRYHMKWFRSCAKGNKA